MRSRPFPWSWLVGLVLIITALDVLLTAWLSWIEAMAPYLLITGLLAAPIAFRIWRRSDW